MTSIESLPLSRDIADPLRATSGVEGFAKEFRATIDAVARHKDLVAKAAAIPDPFADALRTATALATAGSGLTKSIAASGISPIMEQSATAAVANCAAAQSMASEALEAAGSRLTDIVGASAISKMLGATPALAEFPNLASMPVVDFEMPNLVDPVVDTGRRTTEVLYDVRAELTAYREERRTARDDDRRRWRRYWWITGVIAFAAAGFGALITVLLT